MIYVLIAAVIGLILLFAIGLSWVINVLMDDHPVFTVGLIWLILTLAGSTIYAIATHPEPHATFSPSTQALG